MKILVCMPVTQEHKVWLEKAAGSDTLIYSSQEEIPEEAVPAAREGIVRLEPAQADPELEPVHVKDHILLLTCMLVFYIVYTLWYGFSIFELFEGIGLAMTKSKVKQES